MSALIRLFTRRKKKETGELIASKGELNSNTKRSLKTDLECKIMHLEDDTEFTFYLPRNALASQLYDYVFHHLGFNGEEDYFGLQYTDTRNINHWLDPTKKIRKQCEIGPPYTLKLCVKFFSSEPQYLKDEFTRYLFVLQLRREIRSGRLSCDYELAAELAALCLQGEFGDYDEEVHTLNFISSFRFLPEHLQTEDFEHAIVEHYQSLAGRCLTPAYTDKLYLEKARLLDNYGVNMHHVQGKDNSDYVLGLTPTGILVYEGDRKIGLFFWPMILKLEFKKHRLKLVVADEDEATKVVNEHTFIFTLPDHRACKHLWKCAVEHHTFFRVAETQRPPSKRQQVFRMRSRFHSSFRTERQLQRINSFGSTTRRSSTFVRQPSKRFSARPSFERQELKAKRNKMLHQKRNALEVKLPASDINRPGSNVPRQPCSTNQPVSNTTTLHVWTNPQATSGASNTRDPRAISPQSGGSGKSPTSLVPTKGNSPQNLAKQNETSSDSSDSESDSGGRFIDKRFNNQEPKHNSTRKWSEQEEKECIAAEKAQAILKGLEEPSSSSSKPVKTNVNLLHSGSEEDVDNCGDTAQDFLIPMKNNEVNLYAPKSVLLPENFNRNILNTQSVSSHQEIAAEFPPAEHERSTESGAVVDSGESAIKLTNLELAEKRERQKLQSTQYRKTSLPRPVTRSVASSEAPANTNPHQPSRLPKAPSPASTNPPSHAPPRHSLPSSLPVLSNSPIKNKVIGPPSTEAPVLPNRQRPAAVPSAGSSIPTVNPGSSQIKSRIQPPTVTRTSHPATSPSNDLPVANQSNQNGVSENSMSAPQLKTIPRPSAARLASCSSGSQLPVSNRSRIPAPSSSSSETSSSSGSPSHAPVTSPVTAKLTSTVPSTHNQTRIRPPSSLPRPGIVKSSSSTSSNVPLISRPHHNPPPSYRSTNLQFGLTSDV